MSKELGQYLKLCRKIAEKSQKESAKLFGYSNPQFVSNWERGVAIPPPSAMRKMIKIYGLHPGDRKTILYKIDDSFKEKAVKKIREYKFLEE